MSDDTFLSRWSRRKAERQSGVRSGDTAPPDPQRSDAARESLVDAHSQNVSIDQPPTAPPATPPIAPGSVNGLSDSKESVVLPPPPTLADVALLTREDSYARFVAPGVDPAVRNAAMKKLFTDPHYNVMDGLDIYIDDYGKPDPIPIEMLRRMTQSKSLGLFDHEDEEPATVTAKPESPPATDKQPMLQAAETSPDEDPDLQLQPDDGARRPGAGQGAEDCAEP